MHSTPKSKSFDESEHCNLLPPRREESEHHHLPNELILEILKFLSLKSLSRFKCVCKSWCAAIEERYFIRKHYEVAKVNYTYKPGCNLHSGEENFVALCTLTGLVLETSKLPRKYRIRNPTTKQTLDLPDPGQLSLHMTMMYLLNTKKYVLACFYYKIGTESGGCKVLTVEKDHKWRNLHIPWLSNLGSEELGKCSTECVNGNLFFFRRSYPEILCIDMETESFSSVKIPQLWDFFSGHGYVKLRKWNGKLSVCKLVKKDGVWKLCAWVLEDFKRQIWAEKPEVIPLTFMEKYPNTKETDVLLQNVDFDWLNLIVSKKHHVVYHMKSKSLTINSAPPGLEYSFYHYPTLVRLDGMKEEEK